jgi:2-succinyl-5-enolpyruvyl-6-hydroxy-3-cyclohexene-1-carboxylate synthase
MPVRDVEWFGKPRQGVRVISNRGANGIDGVLSTALGAALADRRPTVALLGDLAFLYDAGSLLWGRDRDVALRVVVVDNDGGGIFSFLPHAGALSTDVFERFWGTPHGIDTAAVGSAYGVDARHLPDRAALGDFLSGSAEAGIRIGVVRTDRRENVTHHDRLNQAVARAMSRLVPPDP